MSGAGHEAIEILDASVVLGGAESLRGFSLVLREGEHACILGPNGSGKSTLVRLIAGEVYPVYRERAPVRLFGHERWNLFELRSRLGIVSERLQSAQATGDLAFDVVLSGFYGSVGLPPRAEPTAAMLSKAAEAAARMGVERLLGRRSDTLSSGEMRRVLVARALVHDPDMLLLDEPYSSLDLAAKAAFAASVRALAASGHAIVLVTHDLSEIGSEIERVVLVKDGRVLADGPKEELLTSETMSELYGARVIVAREGEPGRERYRAWAE
jgi:iron complex transport system ATP-binding protein